MGDIVPIKANTEEIDIKAEFPIVFSRIKEPVKELAVYGDYLVALTHTGKVFSIDPEGNTQEITL